MSCDELQGTSKQRTETLQQPLHLRSVQSMVQALYARTMLQQ